MQNGEVDIDFFITIVVGLKEKCPSTRAINLNIILNKTKPVAITCIFTFSFTWTYSPALLFVEKMISYIS